MHKKEESNINCPTFQKQEIVIHEITNKINQAKGVQEKARFCEELEKEIKVILNCPDYDKKRLDCRGCRFIADLRKKAATLIIKAKKLT